MFGLAVREVLAIIVQKSFCSISPASLTFSDSLAEMRLTVCTSHAFKEVSTTAFGELAGRAGSVSSVTLSMIV